MSEALSRDRDELYLHAGELLVNIGREGFGIPITEDSAARVGRALLLVSEVDAVIDDIRPEAEIARVHILGLINHEDSNYAWQAMQSSNLVSDKIKDLAGNLRDELRPDECDTFLGHARGIIFEQENEKVNIDVRDRAEVALKVGAHSADMFLAMFSEEERTHPMFERYARCFRYLGQCGASADWAQDLRQDYQDGLTKVEPTVRNQIVIVYGGAMAFFKAAKEMGSGMFKVTGIFRKLMMEGVRSAFTKQQ